MSGRQRGEALLLLTLGLAGTLPGQTITEFPIPTAESGAMRITVGPDGNLWFTESQGNKIGRITPAGQISEFAVPTPGAFPSGIAAGPDGNVWFAENGANRIGRIITPQGSITELPIPDAFPLGGPGEITAGPDGNLWFTETDGGLGGRVRRLTVTGQFSGLSSPPPSAAPHEIIAGADGNLWTTLTFSGRIARVSTGGAIVEFPTPVPSGLPLAIGAGPDGRVWFGEDGALTHRVGRIDPNGAIAVFPVSGGLIGGIAGAPGWESLVHRDGRDTRVRSSVERRRLRDRATRRVRPVGHRGGPRRHALARRKERQQDCPLLAAGWRLRAGLDGYLHAPCPGKGGPASSHARSSHPVVPEQGQRDEIEAAVGPVTRQTECLSGAGRSQGRPGTLTCQIRHNRRCPAAREAGSVPVLTEVGRFTGEARAAESSYTGGSIP